MQGPPASTLFPYTTLFRSRAVLALRLRVVRHGNDDLRLELMDDLGGLRGGQVDVGARDRNEDDVDVPDALEVGGRQLVAEVAQVADDEVVEPDGEDGVTSARRAAAVIVERADPRDENLVHLVLAGTP